jgi:hypothetical protein
MATVVTNAFRQAMATSGVNLSADNFVVALMDSWVIEVDVGSLKQNYGSWATTISAHEVSGTGYSAIPLTAPIVSATGWPGKPHPEGEIVYWKGNNLTWNNITVRSYGIAIYRPSDNLVVGYISFGYTEVVVVNGSLTVQWDPAGIMNIF